MKTLQRTILLTVLLLALATTLSAEPITLGERWAFESEVLGDERDVLIYLPSAYASLPEAKFPVVYMVDGDYNFHYVSGLIEQMAPIAELMPEVILVAIGDKGVKTYRNDMAPTLESENGEKGGDASTFMRFLEEELIPKVESRYRVADHRSLIGMSMGGLFTVATLLEKPDLFNTYYAISPSLWWQNKALNRHAEKVFKNQPELKARLYVTLANERDMGIYDFVDVLDSSAPSGLDWKFRLEESESHYATGLPSLRWAFLQAFAGYDLPSSLFYTFETAPDLIAHYAAQKQKHGFEFLLPARALQNVLAYYQRKDLPEQAKALETSIQTHFPASLPLLKQAKASLLLAAEKWPEALELFESLIATSPQNFDAWAGAAKANQALGNSSKANQQIEKAVELGKKHARSWQVKQLRADWVEISERSGSV